MNKVEVTRPLIPGLGLFSLVVMQVCAEQDATDEEILAVCNRDNPCGTTNGWTTVVREVNESSIFHDENKMPVACKTNPGRLHFLVLC